MISIIYPEEKELRRNSSIPSTIFTITKNRLSSPATALLKRGLIADLKSPDIETRIAILKKKSELEGISLSESVALYIADKVESNIRVLEGYLRRVIAYASLKGEKIELDLAKEALKSLLDSSTTQVTVEKIQKIVCQRLKIKPSFLKSKNNSPDIVFPRQIAMYLCHKLTSASLPEIGKKFGGKHHTTVIHSIRKIEKLRNEDSEFNKEIHSLINCIK